MTLRKYQQINGFTFKGYSDTEILLKAYICFGYDVVNYLNGVFAFAIWNKNKEESFIARDHFGIKPLYYTFKDNNIIFASEIKALFKYPNIKKVLDRQGISELIGIGPAHSPGLTVFKDIFELKPAHYAIFSRKRFL